MKTPAPSTVLERPPEGPARGPVGAPVWLVASLSAGLALFAAFCLMRAWQRRSQ